MAMRLYNTLTRRKDRFEPIEPGKVRMYSCGLTVYNYAHIGNLRTYIFSDILRRSLEYEGYDVNQVMNVTDVGHLTSDADAGEDKMEKEALKTAERLAKSLEKLINDLLDASLIDSGHLTIDSKLVELGSVLEREIKDADQQPSARELRFSRPDHDVWANVDPLRLGQIVSNLLSNSFKYSPPGSTVEVTLSVTDVGVQVAIHNRGDGVSLADEERVFERFYRAGNGLTQNAGGVGLGLYIARRLAEAMGGGLALSPSPDDGWTFVLTLPSSLHEELEQVSRHPLDLASELA